MNGLIILDGPDGTGKTTLAEFLVKKHDAVYMHLTYRWKDKMFEYHTAALHKAVKLSTTRLVVIDRLWPSEVCYANAYRGGSKWPTMWRMMDRVINKVAGLYVICLPHDTREYVEDFQRLKASREEMFSDILPVAIEYHKLWDRMKDWPHAIRYDRFKEVVSSFAERLTDQLVEHQKAQDKHISDPNNYNCLGHIGMADFIVIADWKSPRKRYPTWWPFYGYDVTSNYLRELWNRLGYDEHRFIWTTPHSRPASARYLLNRYQLVPLVLGSGAYNHIARPTSDYLRFGKPNWLAHPAYEVKFSDHPSLSTNIAAIVEQSSVNKECDDYTRRASVFLDSEAMRFEQSGKNLHDPK